MKDIKDINLLSMFSYWSVPAEDVEEEYRDMFDEDDEYIIAPEYTIENFENADFDKFETEEFLDYMYELLGNTNYAGFIGFNYNANWQGSQGYKISDNLEDLLLFDFDYSLYLEKQGKDILELKMYSHDVPTGGLYYIIGIVESDDFYYLNEEASFEDVEEFISAYARTFLFESTTVTEATTNSAVMDFDTGKEVEDEFSLNGWNVISTSIMNKATSVVNKNIEAAGYKFAGNIGIYGGFKIPVADYDKAYNIVIDVVTDIIDNNKTPKTPKAKKWDQSKWDKKTK